MLNGMSHTLFWLVLAIILAIIEAVHLGILTIWFAVGALIACLAALLDIDFIYQVIIFVITSGILLYFTRPIVKNYLKLNPQRTNADRLIGELAEVIEDINNTKGTGRVKVLSQDWSARTSGEENISAGQKARVVEIKGARLIVEKTESIKTESIKTESIKAESIKTES